MRDQHIPWYRTVGFARSMVILGVVLFWVVVVEWALS
jgi:hypothetical protein